MRHGAPGGVVSRRLSGLLAGLVDARSSDALNLAALTATPIAAALEVLEDCDRRRDGDSPEAVLMRRALAAGPMTIKRIDP